MVKRGTARTQNQRINHFHQWESVQFDQFYNKPKNFEAFTDELNAPNNRV